MIAIEIVKVKLIALMRESERETYHVDTSHIGCVLYRLNKFCV